jgi:hypothetical protein
MLPKCWGPSGIPAGAGCVNPANPQRLENARGVKNLGDVTEEKSCQKRNS